MNIKLPFKSTSELGRKMFQLLERNKFHARQLICSRDPKPTAKCGEEETKGDHRFSERRQDPRNSPTHMQAHAGKVVKPSGQCLGPRGGG